MTCMHAFHAHQTGSSILFSSVKKKKILHIFTSYAFWDKSHGYGGCRPWQWHLLIFCRGHGTRRYSRTEALMAVARASSSACKAKKKQEEEVHAWPCPAAPLRPVAAQTTPLVPCHSHSIQCCPMTSADHPVRAPHLSTRQPSSTNTTSPMVRKYP